MSGYRIDDLNSDTIELIKRCNIDKNNDGLINDNNNELAELLSQTGKSEIHELVKKNSLNNILIGTGIISTGSWFVGDYFQKSAAKASISFSEIMKEVSYLRKNSSMYKHQAFADVLKTHLNSINHKKKAGKNFKGFGIGLGAVTAMLALCNFLGKEYVTYENDEGQREFGK